MNNNHTHTLREVFNLLPNAAERGWLSADDAPTDDQAGGGTDDLGDAGQRALTAERAARKEADRQLREALNKLKAVEGIDPTVFREATQKAQELEARNQELLTAADRARQEAEQAYSTKLQQQSQRTSELERQLFEREMEYAGERLFLSAKGRSVVSDAGISNFHVFWQQARGHFARDDQGLYVVDRSAGDGKTPLIDGQSGKRVDPSKYVADVLAEDRVLMHLFEPKFGAGSAASGGGTGRTMNGVDLDGMNSAQLIALGLNS